MRPLIAALFLFVLASPAAAQQAAGLWLRENGESHVRIAPCGDALCGFVAWVKDPDLASDIGLKVFYGMKPSGPGEWEGEAFNPEDGKTYTGRMLVAFLLLIEKLARFASISAFVSGRPSPVPRVARAVAIWRKGSSAVSISLSLMPMPVSRMRITAWPASVSAVETIT